LSNPPGVIIIPQVQPPARGFPTSGGVGFATGQTQKGPANTYVRLRSMQDFLFYLGERNTTSQLCWDAAEAAFKEGLRELYFSRVVGPASKFAELILKDSGAAESLIIKARTPGQWGNGAEKGISIETTVKGAEESFVIKVFLNKVLVQESPALKTQAEAVEWGAASIYIQVILGIGIKMPAALAEKVLAGGTDNAVGIVNASWKEAEEAFTVDLGPGQVAQWGRTTKEAWEMMTERCEKIGDRIALCDGPDTPTVATLEALSQGMRIKAGINSWGGAFAPWVKIPGLTPGTTRTVPPSAILMGRIASAEAETQNPNQAAAGPYGECIFAVGLSQVPWTDEQRAKLNEEGINVIKTIQGIPTVYGFRTFVNPVTEPECRSGQPSSVLRHRC
jgi:hypothetical protein